ncbi:hypothetical protein RND81_09G108300 [Saponaria officinalis]|uniref:Protein CHUP1, chloroplastic n=1 Tax=Saponaria officinalis TaxID=3572 RepID=A0AAW1IJE9_SAPOF
MILMLIKERRDVKPLLVKFGVTLAISFAGFLYARFRNKRIKPPNSPPPNSDCKRKVDHGGRLRINDDHQPKVDSVDSYDKPCIRVRANTLSRHASPRCRYSEDKDGFLLPEFDQLVKDMSVETDLPKTIYSIVEKNDYEHEIENLKRRVRYLRERERKLEVQLLEYYGLKEQEKAMMELQNRVKINNIEAKLFSMKIESLEAENVRLAAQASDYSKVVSELEEAKTKIKLLKRKIRYEAQQNKEQILELTQRVTRFRDHEHEACSSDLSVRKMTDLETEAKELKKCNENLKEENADLAQRLESTQFLANSLLEDQEKEELNKEIQNLRSENEKLTKDAERLQADRCGDAEELVYLRWINACLRYELRNYQPPPGKTVARDLSKCLSPTSEKKAKQLILEYANTEDGDQKESNIDFDFDNWPSSQPSYLTDSTEHDDSPRHGSSNKNHKKLKIFARLRRLITGKSSHQRNNQSGRVSPIYRSYSVDDLGRRRCSSESPRDNSCHDGGTDESLKLASSSQNSNNSSLEFQPLSRLDEEVSKDGENNSRMSESSNYSPRSYRPEQDSEDGQKSELVKYAQVLRDSRSSPRMHKKSASYCTG